MSLYRLCLLRSCEGLAVTRDVIRRFSIAVAPLLAQARSCGICDGQSGTGVGFLRVPRFLMPFTPPIAHRSSSSIIFHPGWYNRPNSRQHTKWTQSPLPKNQRECVSCAVVSAR
jgi:hypothetical protein